MISSRMHPAAFTAFPAFLRMSCFCLEVAFDII
nr:MAG TPA_asm: hypothetical protein [Inoviridae sp.]